MKSIDRRDRRPAPPSPAPSTFRSTVVRVWDVLFGAPRVHDLPDGSVAVRLLGRRFEASSRGALFDAVARERERLLVQVGKMHEGAAIRPLIGGARLSDTHHHQTRRMEDRISLYTAFLGRLGRELGLDGKD